MVSNLPLRRRCGLVRDTASEVALLAAFVSFVTATIAKHSRVS